MEHLAAGHALQQPAMVGIEDSSDPLQCLESRHHLDFDTKTDQGLLRAAGERPQAISSAPIPTPPNCSAAGRSNAARTRRYQRSAPEPDTPRQCGTGAAGSGRSSPSGSPTAPPAKQAKQQQSVSPSPRAADMVCDACAHNAPSGGAVLVLAGTTLNLTVDARGPAHGCPQLCLPAFVALGRAGDHSPPAQAPVQRHTPPTSHAIALAKACGATDAAAQGAHSPVCNLDPLCQPTTPLMHAATRPCSSGSSSGSSSGHAPSDCSISSSSCSSHEASPSKASPLAQPSASTAAAQDAAGATSSTGAAWMPSWQLQQALEAHHQQQQQVPAGGSSTAAASQDVATVSSGTSGEALGAGHWAAALWERVQCLEARNRELEQVAGGRQASQQRDAQDHAAALSALLDQVRQLQRTLAEQQAATTAQASAAAAAQEALSAATQQRRADQALIAQLQAELVAAGEYKAQLLAAQAALGAEREAGSAVAAELRATQQQVAGLQAAAAHKEGLLQQQAALVAVVAALTSGGRHQVAGGAPAAGKDLEAAAATDLLEPSSKADAAAAAAAGKDTGKDTGAAAAAAAPLLALSVELVQLRSLYSLLQADYAELEGCLKESERLRREATARYAFTLLDEDHDGLVPAGALGGYEVFSPLPALALGAVLERWAWSSGTPGLLSADDFVRLVEVVQDRERPEVQRFWFNALDLDGDGYVGPQDMRQLYESVDRSSAGFVVPFPDLVEQIYDMVGLARSAAARAQGFTSMQLRRSKLAPGVIGLLVNHGNMLLQRTTAEWGRGNYPL